MNGHTLLRKLGSAKLALWLIGILIAMNLLSVLVPQRIVLGANFEQFVSDSPVLASISDVSGLSRVFTGWPIVVISILLAVNVTACTALRLMRRRTPAVPGSVRSAKAVGLSKRWRTPEAFLDAAAAEFGSSAWRIMARTSNGFVASAGRIGFWGSMVLHASILVFIVGGALTAVTSFKGEMAITDGESVVDVREAYINVTNMPELGSAFTETRLTVDSTVVKYEQGQVVSAIARMRGIEPDGRIVNKDVRVNHPLDVGGKSYLLLNSGYAIAVTIETSATAPLPQVVRMSEETPYGWRDSLGLPPTADGRTAELRFLATPVPRKVGEQLPVEKFDLADPRLRAKLVIGGEEVWEGEFEPGQRQVLGPGIALTFEGMRLWDRFLVRAEPARWITYVGFWMAVVGAAVRFLFPERRFAVVTGEVDGRRVADVVYRVRPWSGFEGRSDARLEQTLLELAGGAPVMNTDDASTAPTDTETT